MRATYRPGAWIVYYRDRGRIEAAVDPLVSAYVKSSRSRWEREVRAGQPFILDPSGRADPVISEFFASRRTRARDPKTVKKYAQSLGLWLNFLAAIGRTWDQACEEDAEYFKDWRLTDEANPALVETSTFKSNVMALRVFYGWAASYGIANPFACIDDRDVVPRGVREKDPKWLDPAGYRRWRNLGLLGHNLEGRPDPRWRGRSGQRDAAFADGLYNTGLRLSEWGSILLVELPEDDPARGYFTCWLADAAAKRDDGHKYWLSRPALLEVLGYCEGARARAVRAAQRRGRYERIPGVRVVLEHRGGRLWLLGPDGREVKAPLDRLDVDQRRLLFRRTAQGLEPLAVWLNEDGMPRDPHGWHHTFTRANERIAAMGLAGFRTTPHRLRHSCALRWYAVGKLAWHARFGHLDEEEARDFRDQFGSVWNLVATILGHRNPETTKRIYLEPFQSLEVELLIEHVHEAFADQFLQAFLAGHPRVLLDPLRQAS